MNTEIKTNIPIDVASVKVMRSHDYCHFEVCLSTTLRNQIDATGQVDELRKTAARLADKAVVQYQVAKENCSQIEQEERGLARLNEMLAEANAKPEEQRTPHDKAVIKWFSDQTFKARRHYDYEDDYEEPDKFEEPEFEGDVSF